MSMFTFNKYNKEDYQKEKINVCLFVQSHHNKYVPTSYIRLFSTFRRINDENGYNISIINDYYLFQKSIENNTFLTDILIIQRNVLRDINFCKKLVDYCKIFDIKMIFEIDDDLLNMSTSHPEYEYYIEKIKIMKFLIKRVDLVTVSTFELKQNYEFYNENIEVIPNVVTDYWEIDDKRNNYEKEDNHIKIGYMGSSSHKNDIKILEEAIEELSKEYDSSDINLDFEIIGLKSNLNMIKKINIPNDKKQYPSFIKWLKNTVEWDIALAPLLNTEINQSKSSIKYLDYSMLKVPGIYSYVGPYKKVIVDGKNGLLVKENTKESWKQAIKKLINNKKLREEIIVNSSEDLVKNYNLKDSINSWKFLLNKFSRNQNTEIFTHILLFMDSDYTSFSDYLNKNTYDIIKNSDLFNYSWYLSEYEDVKNNDLDPLYHYITFGCYENCKPYPSFSEEKRLLNFQINPLVKEILYKNLNENLDDELNDELIKKQIIKYNLSKQKSLANNYYRKNKVTVIIPIYNAFESTKRCIESVFKFTNDFNLILINDNSSDFRIKELLDYYGNYENVLIFNNSVNNGFTKNVNFGIKVSKEDDVVLLNSDTIVTNNWLERITTLAYSDKHIGTVTPISNASDISIPLNWDSIPSFEEVEQVGFFLSNSHDIDEKFEAPTGNGFCLFIKRETIKDVGLFDEESFGKGYGEESDFTMRAFKRGWKNIRTPSTFVFHEKSASFSISNADKLKKSHKEIILRKHPKIFIEWDSFYNSDLLQNFLKNTKKNIVKLSDNILHKNVLILTTEQNNYPFIEDYKDIVDNYNIFCITWVNNELRLWFKNHNSIELVDKLKIKSLEDIGIIKDFYVNIFIKLNIWDVFINHNLTITDLPSFYSIFPIIDFEQFGIKLHYIRPNQLTDVNQESNNNIFNISKLTSKNCVVYTAITGGYDNLNDPEFIDPDFDYICFTDNPNLKSNVWQIRQIDIEDDNPIKTARKFKILPHKYLKEYEYSFWVDGSFKIVGDLKQYVKKYSKNSSILTVKHIRRNDIYDESESCIRMKKDNTFKIKEQIRKYKSEGYPKNNGLIESGFIFRKHKDEEVKKIMNQWYDEVKNHSSRDQISFNYVIWKNKFNYDSSDIIIWKNQFIINNMNHSK